MVNRPITNLVLPLNLLMEEFKNGSSQLLANLRKTPVSLTVAEWSVFFAPTRIKTVDS